jgi:hypothetical protein
MSKAPTYIEQARANLRGFIQEIGPDFHPDKSIESYITQYSGQGPVESIRAVMEAWVRSKSKRMEEVRKVFKDAHEDIYEESLDLIKELYPTKETV